MVSGKPPSRSKSDKEPVTIDLEADKTAPVAGEAASTEGMDREDVQAQSAVEDIAPAERPDIAHDTIPEDVATGQAVADKPEMGARPEEPAATEEFEQARPREADFTHGAPLQPAVQRPSTSGLVAAGIVGGLVALALAGSIVYAGFLPRGDDTAALSSQISALNDKIASLEARPQQAGGDTSALEGRLAALETAMAASAALPPSSPDDGRLSALREEIDTLKTALVRAEKTSSDTGRELATRLYQAEQKLDEPREDIAVAKAIAAAALKAAIDRGGSFQTELQTLEGVAADDPSVAELKSFAASGVPSRLELARRMPDVANAVLDALNPVDPNQGILSRLQESALSVIKVRPVGNVEGEGPGAILARMEDKLRSGDLDGAAQEWNALPDNGKAASADFKSSLDARIRVESLVGSTLGRAVTSTAKQN